MKLGAVILSFTILIQSFNISLSDILQLNEFIEHAQFHKEKYGDDFFTFLSKHYGEDKVDHEKEHQEELPEHEKLPFNQQSNYTVDFQILLFTDVTFAFEKALFDRIKKADFYYQNIYSSTYKNGIFQPPQHA